MPKFIVVAVLSWAVLVSGCAGLLRKTEAPVVTLSGIQMQEMTLFEQRYQLQLRVQNSNDFDLPLEGLRCTLFINEREFAQGVGAADVTVPRFGDAIVPVNVISNLQRVLEQLRASGDAGVKPVSYRLIGKLSVEGYPTALPFEYKGEINLRELGQM